MCVNGGAAPLVLVVCVALVMGAEARAPGHTCSLASVATEWVDINHARLRVRVLAPTPTTPTRPGDEHSERLHVTCVEPRNDPMAPLSQRGGFCDWDIESSPRAASEDGDARSATATGSAAAVFNRTSGRLSMLVRRRRGHRASEADTVHRLAVEGTVSQDCRTIVWDRSSADLGVHDAWIPTGLGHTHRWVPYATVSTVHLVYMTHLDVGYTLPSSLEVMNEYFTQWFPKAYETAANLTKRGGKETFVWTTHPWLVAQYFANATGNVSVAQVADLSHALESGTIQLHAGAFNIQSEVSTPAVAAASHAIAHELCDAHGLPRPITASQKDVPGCTVGIVKTYAEAGIEALHVGVNDFSRPPAVPQVSPPLYAPVSPFVWRDTASGADVVCYWSSGYSRMTWAITPELIVQVPGSSIALAFLMNVDNRGPQNDTQVLEGWDNLAKVFPGADIHVSSLDAYTNTVLPAKATLPVVTDELGDTWIQGIASDPLKMSAYRVAARQYAQAAADGTANLTDSRVRNFARFLAKLPEHTWGFNEGELAGENFSNAWLDANMGQPVVQRNLAAYAEQRSYINNSLAALEDHPLAAAINDEIDAAGLRVPAFPSLAGLQSWASPSTAPPSKCGALLVSFSDTGAITHLSDTASGRTWVDAKSDPTKQLSRLRYATHSEDEGTTFVQRYLNPPCSQQCNGCDFKSCNLSHAGAEKQEVDPLPVTAWRSADPASDEAAEACSFVFNVTFPSSVQTKYGAPGFASLAYQFDESGSGAAYNLTLNWFNKRPTRMAESIWLSWSPLAAPPAGWSLHKMGREVSPLNVVVNGSRSFHGILEGVSYSDASASASVDTGASGQGSMAVTAWDSPLVGVQERNPYLFMLDDQVTMPDGVHFCPFTNAYWQTNYPVMSQRPDETFRYTVSFGSSHAPVKP